MRETLTEYYQRLADACEMIALDAIQSDNDAEAHKHILLADAFSVIAEEIGTSLQVMEMVQ